MATPVTPANRTKRSLGRGLSELLSSAHLSPTTVKPELREEPRSLPIELLRPGKYQPRRDMDPDALQELAASIRAQGILQPILVRMLQKDQYEIIAGERRWRAAQLAGLDKVPVFLREISDETAMAMGLIENIQREDLNAMEQALALKRLSDEFKLTHEEVAQAVGKSRAMVSNLLRLLHLEAPVKELLEEGVLDMGHGRALLALSPIQQVELANIIVAKNLSVRATEELVRKSQQGGALLKKPAQKPSPDVLRLEAELADKLGAKVAISHKSQGKGKLVIHYHSLEELEVILERIG